MGYLRFGLPQIETDMTISRDLSEVFSKKLHEPILMKPLYQSKEKNRTQLEQFSSSAPICVVSSSLHFGLKSKRIWPYLATYPKFSQKNYMSRFLRSPSINPKKKTRTQLEQFSSSAPTYVYNAPLLLPGPRFFTRILIGILVSGPPMF